ncbi:hypothetical protein IWX76_000395 [Pedobacter sp. CAN_A7]|uniref:hypothetical protein n=1 Tax=Pedobacter sp. CAN_A7 TaxID=2787722 RepID=UPI0018C9DC7E
MRIDYIKTVLISAFILVCTLQVAAQQAIIKQAEPNLYIKNEVPMERSLSLINALQPVSFDYDYKKINSLPKGKQYSLKVDEVKHLANELIYDQFYSSPKGKNSNHQVKVKTVDLEKLVPFIIKALQEQQQEIEELKRLLAAHQENSVATK